VKKVLITGASGYFGSRFASFLESKSEIEGIVGTDIRPPGVQHAKFTFYERDVRESCEDLLRKYEVDTVIHTAWILPPIHDKAKMEDININGTKAVMDSAAKAGVGQVLYTSSTTAYGFHLDNDNPLTEESPLRGNDDFTYSKCKRLVEPVVHEFARAHPNILVTVVRPCFVVGPGFKNPMATHLRKKIVLVPSPRAPLQLVHEDDLVRAMYELLVRRKAGAFNIAGDGVLSFDDMARLLGNVPLPLPFKLLWCVNALAWFLRLSFLTEFPSPTLNIFRYSWVAANDKLKKEIGFKYKYTTKTAFEDFARHVRQSMH
jgi:UDP-glucose 4-epimerase